MLFNSYPFVFLFLPITLAGFFTLGRRSRGLAIAWLALASFFFYGWWNPVHVGLLLASITFNYLIARCLHFLDRTAAAPHRKPLLVLAVGANLGLLAYYKYTGFFLRNLNALAGTHLAADIVLRWASRSSPSPRSPSWSIPIDARSTAAGGLAALT